MNAKGVEVLTKAAMDGVRQIRGAFADADGGRCALGVLADAAGVTYDGDYILHGVRLQREYGLDRDTQCPECGTRVPGYGIVSHLNDEHGIDFLGIARKLGPDA